jgi:diaminopimelate decarboxylase
MTMTELEAHVLERYGSPAYLYDLDLLERQAQRLAAVVPAEARILYSLKANPHAEIAAALRTAAKPCSAEISSTGELEAALAAGFEAGDCLYTGPGKTALEITVALTSGVRLFSVESLADFRRIERAASALDVQAGCLLRVNVANAGPGGASGFRMMGSPSQFGFDAECLPSVLPTLVNSASLKVAGAHFFSVSNARSEQNLIDEFTRSAAAAAELAAAYPDLFTSIGLGGGFAAPFACPGEPERYRSLAGRLPAILDHSLPGWRLGRPDVFFESGRYLVGPCGALLATIVNVKRSRDRTFVVLDAGINVLGGLSGLGRALPVAVDLGEPASPAERGESVALVGPLCTPADVLGRHVFLDQLREGRVVRIPNVGAYGLTASLVAFLSRPTPIEVVVRRGSVKSVSRLNWHRTAVAAVDDGVSV